MVNGNYRSVIMYAIDLYETHVFLFRNILLSSKVSIDIVAELIHKSK